MIELLQSPRLKLRGFSLLDAGSVQKLAAEFEIADTTLRIPHPYYLTMAEDWIISQETAIEEERELTWAITLSEEACIIGSIGLVLNPVFKHAELGYWIGKPFWGSGYATEAARLVLEYAFNQIGLQRVHAHHMSRNPASGKVLLKIGMKHEGCLRQHILKWNKFEDIDMYGILQSEYRQGGKSL